MTSEHVCVCVCGQVCFWRCTQGIKESSLPPAAVRWAVWIYDNYALKVQGLGDWKCFLGRGEVRGFYTILLIIQPASVQGHSAFAIQCRNHGLNTERVEISWNLKT